MNTLHSIVQRRGAVPLAAFTGERVYMRPIQPGKPLPFDLARWQPTVDAMLNGIDADVAYLMIDQARVAAGVSHRRPGVHIDGYWNPGLSAHAPEPTHGSSPPPRDSHSGSPRHMGGARGWAPDTSYLAPEGLLLVSSITAARAYAGQFDRRPGDGGDCSHLDVSAMQALDMEAGVVYAGNVTMLHESLPVPMDCLRTVVRLNVPGWTPERSHA
jgi:hypothetical protein